MSEVDPGKPAEFPDPNVVGHLFATVQGGFREAEEDYEKRWRSGEFLRLPDAEQLAKGNLAAQAERGDKPAVEAGLFSGEFLVIGGVGPYPISRLGRALFNLMVEKRGLTVTTQVIAQEFSDTGLFMDRRGRVLGRSFHGAVDNLRVATDGNIAFIQEREIGSKLEVWINPAVVLKPDRTLYEKAPIKMTKADLKRMSLVESISSTKKDPASVPRSDMPEISPADFFEEKRGFEKIHPEVYASNDPQVYKQQLVDFFLGRQPYPPGSLRADYQRMRRQAVNAAQGERDRRDKKDPDVDAITARIKYDSDYTRLRMLRRPDRPLDDEFWNSLLSS